MSAAAIATAPAPTAPPQPSVAELMRSLARPDGFAAGRLSVLQSYMLTQSSDAGRRSQLTNLLRVASIFNTHFYDLRWEEMRADDLRLVMRVMEREREVARRGRVVRKRYSPATVNATLSAMKGMARACCEKGLITREVYLSIKDVKGARGSRVSPHRPRDAGELLALLECCDEDAFEVCAARDGALVALLAGAGLRRSEVVRLELKDYDTRARALTVVGKGDKARRVYFEDGGAHERLLRWLAVRGDSPGPLLCPVDRTGRVRVKRMGSQTVYFAVRRRAVLAGLDPFAPHALRHTLGTALITAGAPLTDVQQILGHSRVETTERYDHRTEETQRRAMRLYSLPRPRSKRKPHSARRRRHGRGVNVPPKIPLTREVRRRLAEEQADGDPRQPAAAEHS